jgi:hypothetical protein
MTILKVILKSFDAGTYKATLQMAGSDKVYPEGVAVAKNIASAAMVNGSKRRCCFLTNTMRGKRGGDLAPPAKSPSFSKTPSRTFPVGYLPSYDVSDKALRRIRFHFMF